MSRQLVDPRWFSVDRLFVISNVQTAQSAIALIVQEGEGTKQSPLDGSATEMAHYYRFEAIVRGHQLRPTAREPGFAWTAKPSRLIPAASSFQPDLKLADLTPGSRAHEVASRFADAYTRLLNSLHRTFNGEPTFIGNAIAVMFELRVAALDCLYTPIGDPTRVGLCFELEPIAAL